jgi:hypothetical protein
MTTIKTAATRNGYGIALRSGTSQGTVKGTFYAVTRYDRNHHFTLHRTFDYEEARRVANREWLADMGR